MTSFPQSTAATATPTDWRSNLEQAETLPFPWWKRAMDILGCLFLIPVLGAIYMATALVLQLRSPGPIFFRQVRIGLHGRKFILYKLRTMRLGAENSSHAAYLTQLITSNAPMEKLDTRGDSRLIPGARFVRAAGIDELPQIINVVRGDMTLVGPRPCLPVEFQQYPVAAAGRFQVRPGLTGLWQVRGKNHTTFEEMIRLDTEYARHITPWGDLKILFLTVPTLLRQVAELRSPRPAALSDSTATVLPAISPATVVDSVQT